MNAVNATIAAGLFDVALAVFHMLFWRLFGWPQRLAGLDATNRSIIQVLNLALIALCLIVGSLLVLHPGEVVSTLPGRWLLGGIALFYAARFAVHPLFFKSHDVASLVFLAAIVAAGIFHALPLWLRG